VDLKLTKAQIEAWGKLTKRQRACIDAMLAGHYSDKAIARAVGLQVNTVMDHLKQARAKLGVVGRIELVLTAERLHLREQMLAEGSASAASHVDASE